MKIAKILITILLISSSSLFADTAVVSEKWLYTFGSAEIVITKEATIPSETPEVTSTETTHTTVAVNVEATPADTEINHESKETLDPENLLKNTQNLIRDKIIEKYQHRIDASINRIKEKLSKKSPEERESTLNDAKTKAIETRKNIAESKTLDPLKKEITLTILDHLLLRIQWLMDQKAQTPNMNHARA